MRRQISILGLGNVGSSLLAQLMNVSAFQLDINIIDPAHYAEGALWDFQHALKHRPRIRLFYNDAGRLAESDFIFHCAGKLSGPGESRMAVRKENIQLTDEIFLRTQLKETAYLIAITNPVDVVSWHAWRHSGLPANQVMGIGTFLEQGRLAWYLSREAGVHPSEVETWVLGEHGESQVPIFSQTRIKGRPLEEWNFGEGVLKKCALLTRTAAFRIRQGQPATRWAVSFAASRLFEALNGMAELHIPLSIKTDPYFRKQWNLPDIYMGLPAKVNGEGVHPIGAFELLPGELTRLQESGRFIERHLFD